MTMMLHHAIVIAVDIAVVVVVVVVVVLGLFLSARCDQRTSVEISGIGFVIDFIIMSKIVSILKKKT